MPRFKAGDPQVVFIARDGRKFTKTFHSRTAAAKAVVGWRKAGGRISHLTAFSGARRYLGSRGSR